MANIVLTKAKWYWEDYNGSSWSRLDSGNWGDGLGSYTYPSAYSKPKSLFAHYQIPNFNDEKYKLDKVEFIIILGKFKTSENDFPTIKVFYGDNNAPYRKNPIKTVKAFTRLPNEIASDSYVLSFNLTGVTPQQLANLIVEVDWSKSKVGHQSTISVNRCRLNVEYSAKLPRWSLYENVDKTSTTTDKKIAWKLTAKNTGYCSGNAVTLQLPKGVTVASTVGQGTYNNNTKTWTIPTTCKGESATRTFYLKTTTTGQKTLVALNNHTYKTNVQVVRRVLWNKYVPPIQSVTNASRDDRVIYNYDNIFEKEEGYIDITIYGMKENHPIGIACYQLSISDNVELKTPLRDYAELLTDEDNLNVYSIKTDISGEGTENLLCLNVDANKDFVANIRVYIYPLDDTDGTISTQTNTKTYTGEFPILPKRHTIFNFEPVISSDKAYVQNSVNIGSETNWTINAKAHRHNFFDIKKDLMQLELEEQIAYIGVVPLSRCHKADVTATSKNSLIENRYLNRAYYGKKGDYSEDIKMTLRIPWYDVATLQGLCEMDKPIPIDTIPYFPDGDPLNHRGWAEIHEVGNIKKINDLYYECDVGVTYLTHDILTKFNIKKAEKITTKAIKRFLALIHNYNDDLLDLFKLNFYEFWTTLEDANGDKIGSYSIEPNASLKMTKDLNKNSTYDIVYRNSLPTLQSEDYDGNWEMALRVINKANREVLYEHNYSNFKHYDFDLGYAVNTADVEDKYLDGNAYKTLNSEKVSLGYDNLAPLIEDRKIATHFNTMEETLIEELGDKFEIFLLDSDNNGLGNKVVNVNITDEFGFRNSFKVTTDIYGRLIFDPRFGNGDFTIKLTFIEDSKYRGCTYQTTMQVTLTDSECYFEYPSNVTVLTLPYEYKCKVLDENGNGLANMLLHYSYKTATGDYGGEYPTVSDENGIVTIPIRYINGTITMRVAMKGFIDGNVRYRSSQFETEVNINVR